MTERIEKHAMGAGARLAGRIRYDPGVTRAQIRELTVVETDTDSAGDIRQVWENLTPSGG